MSLSVYLLANNRYLVVDGFNSRTTVTTFDQGDRDEDGQTDRDGEVEWELGDETIEFFPMRSFASRLEIFHGPPEEQPWHSSMCPCLGRCGGGGTTTRGQPQHSRERTE